MENLDIISGYTLWYLQNSRQATPRLGLSSHLRSRIHSCRAWPTPEELPGELTSLTWSAGLNVRATTLQTPFPPENLSYLKTSVPVKNNCSGSLAGMLIWANALIQISTLMAARCEGAAPSCFVLGDVLIVPSPTNYWDHWANIL